MKVPLSWLADFVDFDDDAVADQFAALGFPVDHRTTPPVITNVVVGVITKLERHPNADRLQICTIDAGLGTPLTIATAATNVAQGQTVPVAKIGAQLPTMKIEPRKMRGVDSAGMLCSAAELGLPESWFEDGILQLEPGLAPGTDIVGYLGLNRPVIDVEVTTNRPDALCMLGLARELAAKAGVAVRVPREHDLATLPASDRPVPIDVRSADAAEFYIMEVAGAAVGTSPILRRARLAQAGVRPINALVDLTNYVMLEYGRPTHAYDADKVASGGFIVRDGMNEEFLALDGATYTVSPAQLLIADANGPLGLAGVIGGAASAVSADTTRAYIECAQFTGPRIRRSAAACGIRTEASGRFEKGLAPRTTQAAVARLAALAAEIGYTVYAPIHAGIAPAPAEPVVLQAEYIMRLLGTTPSSQTIEAALLNLGCTLIERNATSWTILAPPWRTDLISEVDYVEEVARIAGYDEISEAIAPVVPASFASREYYHEAAVITAFTASGFTEICSLAAENGAVREGFAQAGCVPEMASLEIRNPLSEDQRYLRFSLLNGMLIALARRVHEIRDNPIALVEVGTVFAAGEPPTEQRDIMWCRAMLPPPTNRPWTDEGFLQSKRMSEAALRAILGIRPAVRAGRMFGAHPGKCAEFLIDEAVVARLGVLDPRVADVYGLGDFSIVFGQAGCAELPDRKRTTFRAPSRFPNILRDLALIMPNDVPAAAVTAAMQVAEPLIRSAAIFDEYRGPAVGEKRKSLAVRFALGKDDGTLTDDDAENAVARLLAALKEKFGAELRR